MPTDIRSAFKKAVITVAGVLCVTSALSACATAPDIEVNPDKAVTLTRQINEADSIDLQKKHLTVGNIWEIRIGEDKVGGIYGKTFKLFGESYLIADNDNNLVAGESQKFMHFPRAAETFDSQGHQTGHVDQKMLTLPGARQFDMFKGNRRTATLKQSINPILLNGDIKDSDGSTAYHINRKFGLSTKIHISRKNHHSNVTGTDAILLSIIISDIADSDDKNN